MARPRHEHPTPAELEVLKILWERGESTVREVMDALNDHRPRAYTTVMSLLNVMADKGLVTRTARGRAFVYKARAHRDKTLAGMVGDLWQRAFEGSASTLVAKLLEQANPTPDELDAIRDLLRQYEQGDGA